ncbi:hypothetical protein KVR01_013664 [Diaporthe batatas]|uniref:uncharacterized protein n=1 Tax=Diaporthe batatas TaxID=748121 RepID=UPI001D0383A5|nr:uncharacterized protein KVR01_013664 [Diaporthe batatas]KAG8156430.1 hypothetical protein KVR01_013664 [Diaporthe batatas]
MQMRLFLSLISKSRLRQKYSGSPLNKGKLRISKMGHRRIPKFLQVNTADVLPVRCLFQDGRIGTLAELRDTVLSQNVYLVGLDVEGQEGVSNGVNSIGIAACARPDTKLLTDASLHTEGSVDLSDIMRRHEIDAYVLGCASRRKKAGFERFPFGEVRQIAKDCIETHLLEWLSARLGKTLGQAGEAILVTWGCQGEFHAMATLFPRLARCFSRWVDVSEVVLRTMVAGSKRPSLRDTMLSMGFDRRYVQGTWRQHHSPGMDAARVLAVLIQLWSKPPGCQMEVLPFRMLERERRRIWSQKPPSSTFPFMVRIMTKPQETGEVTSLPEELKFAERLFKFLERNVAIPLAVAVCERKHRGAQESARKGNVGYACFDDKATVDLVLRWDGRYIGAKKLALDNVSLVSEKKASTVDMDFPTLV